MSSQEPATAALPLSEPQLAAITTTYSQHHVALLYQWKPTRARLARSEPLR